MLTAEVFNWTGHVLRTPRTQLKEALARDEAGFTGVYLLFGDKDGEPTLYIGEAEDMRQRLKDHAINKAWWEYVVLVTTSANNLHKAHVKYLESRLVEIAKEVNATTLDNNNQPPRSSLSEASRSNMENFLETLLIVLPAIRIDAFLSKKISRKDIRESEATATSEYPTFVLETPKHGVSARAQVIGGEIVVLAGSRARKGHTSSADRSMTFLKRKRAELFANGVLKVEGDHALFTENYAFSSPSGAGDVINGRSTNGRIEWKLLGSGKTYAEWEADSLMDRTS